MPSHNELNRDNVESRQRARMLDLSRESIFRYDMEDILNASGVPPERINSLVASIWSKASRQGIPDAERFIREKKQEGVIEDTVETKLIRLLGSHSRYR
jgi:hypothetical protein